MRSRKNETEKKKTTQSGERILKDKGDKGDEGKKEIKGKKR